MIIKKVLFLKIQNTTNDFSESQTENDFVKTFVLFY